MFKVKFLLFPFISIIIFQVPYYLSHFFYVFTEGFFVGQREKDFFGTFVTIFSPIFVLQMFRNLTELANAAKMYQNPNYKNKDNLNGSFVKIF